MLDEGYLLSLPRLKHDKSAPYDTLPTRLRWLWVTWAGKILGWKNSRPEDHPQGFDSKVYEALRIKVYPFPKVEQDSCESRQDPNAALAPYTWTHKAQQWTNPGSLPRGGTSAFWLDSMRDVGFIDNNNAIIWGSDPESHLSRSTFEHLLAVLEEAATPATPEASAPASTSAGLGRSVAAAGFTVASARPGSGPPGCVAPGGGRGTYERRILQGLPEHLHTTSIANAASNTAVQGGHKSATSSGLEFRRHTSCSDRMHAIAGENMSAFVSNIGDQPSASHASCAVTGNAAGGSSVGVGASDIRHG
jgi:hypothetical protein